MKIVTIQQAGHSPRLDKLHRVFKPKARPDTTPVHYRRVAIPKKPSAL